MKNFGAFTLAIALMVPGTVLATSSPAGAAPIVTCAKPLGFVTFAPGLTMTPTFQTTKFNLPVKGCKGTGGVKNGTSTGATKGKTKDTCVTFGTPSSTKATVTIKWNTGKSSTAALGTQVVKGAKGVLTATVSGKISKGLFKGKTIKTKVKVTLPAGACGAQPLTKATLTGLSPLTIS